jgi:deoxyribodipyrimidine photo-lyase
MTRDEIVQKLIDRYPWLAGEKPSPWRGGRATANARLAAIDPRRYYATRNYGDGAITQLSPYIHHGVLSLKELKKAALEKAPAEEIVPFLQQLAWREYFQRLLQQHPEWLWHDVEPYKTGWQASDYQEDLSSDILAANTGVACIDYFIRQLYEIGYLHNHARLYLAAYVVHFRRIRWQAGAAWFLTHLLDGDLASNNFSWQWVASTFSHKPYIFNLENIKKYFSGLEDSRFDLNPENNSILNASYEELTQRLFPHKKVSE